MFSHDGKTVRFVSRSVRGDGDEITRTPTEIFLLHVEQARTFEDLRALWFGFCDREGSERVRSRNRESKARQKAKAARV